MITENKSNMESPNLTESKLNFQIKDERLNFSLLSDVSVITWYSRTLSRAMEAAEVNSAKVCAPPREKLTRRFKPLKTWPNDRISFFSALSAVCHVTCYLAVC